MFPLARFRIEDASMEPALRAGDYVLVNRWAYGRRGPRAGDVVVFRDPEAPARLLVKRVERVDPSGAVLVRGDNDAFSRDSRAFGAVGREGLIGKVVLRARA